MIWDIIVIALLVSIRQHMTHLYDSVISAIFQKCSGQSHRAAVSPRTSENARKGRPRIMINRNARKWDSESTGPARDLKNELTGCRTRLMNRDWEDQLSRDLSGSVCRLLSWAVREDRDPTNRQVIAPVEKAACCL